MKKILIKDGWPCAVEVPIHFYSDSPNEETSPMYQASLQLAKDNAVRFKDRQAVFQEIFSRTGVGVNTEGKLYDCPENFEIVIEGEHATLKPLK